MAEPTLDFAEAVSENHFETAHLTSDLKGRSIRGAAVTIGAETAKFFLQLGSTAILARLLTPADFGVVAMVTALTGFMWLFSDLGLSAATVQQAEINQQQVSTLFWINVALGISLAMIAVALAPVVAWFYAEPRLVGIMIAISSTFILSGLTAQHYALLVRRMRFGAATFVQTGSPIVGSVVSIAMAAMGWGYWSLVATVVATSVTAGIMCWMLSGWRPSLPARSANLRAMLGFGSALTGSNILTYGIRNLDNVVVGRFRGPDALGFYSKAYGLVLLPVQQINHPLKGVLVPVLSRLQDDADRFRKYYLAALGLVALGSMPLVAFAAADARTLVLLFLGSRWTAAVPLFQFLSVGAFVSIVAGTADWVMISRGRPDRIFTWYLISAPLTILSFLVGVHWGAAGVAIGFSAVCCVLVLPNLWWALRDSPIRLRDVIGVAWRPAVGSILAALGLFYFVSHQSFTLMPVIALAFHALVISCLYVAILLICPGGKRFVLGNIAIFKQQYKAQS